MCDLAREWVNRYMGICAAIMVGLPFALFGGCKVFTLICLYIFAVLLDMKKHYQGIRCFVLTSPALFCLLHVALAN